MSDAIQLNNQNNSTQDNDPNELGSFKIGDLVVIIGPIYNSGTNKRPVFIDDKKNVTARIGEINGQLQRYRLDAGGQTIGWAVAENIKKPDELIDVNGPIELGSFKVGDEVVISGPIYSKDSGTKKRPVFVEDKKNTTARIGEINRELQRYRLDSNGDILGWAVAENIKKTDEMIDEDGPSVPQPFKVGDDVIISGPIDSEETDSSLGKLGTTARIVKINGKKKRYQLAVGGKTIGWADAENIQKKLHIDQDDRLDTLQAEEYLQSLYHYDALHKYVEQECFCQKCLKTRLCSSFWFNFSLVIVLLFEITIMVIGILDKYKKLGDITEKTATIFTTSANYLSAVVVFVSIFMPKFLGAFKQFQQDRDDYIAPSKYELYPQSNDNISPDGNLHVHPKTEEVNCFAPEFGISNKYQFDAIEKYLYSPESEKPPQEYQEMLLTTEMKSEVDILQMDIEYMSCRRCCCCRCNCDEKHRQCCTCWISCMSLKPLSIICGVLSSLASLFPAILGSVELSKTFDTDTTNLVQMISEIFAVFFLFLSIVFRCFLPITGDDVDTSIDKNQVLEFAKDKLTATATLLTQKSSEILGVKTK